MPSHCLQGVAIGIFGLLLILEDQQCIAAGAEQADFIVGAIRGGLAVAALLKMLQTLRPGTNQHPACIGRKTVCVRQREIAAK